MRKPDIYINSILPDPSCGMISPGYKYPRDEEDMPIIGGKKIERNPDNLIKLETTVSRCMKIRYQNQLLETLEKKVPILYVDCQQKGEDDIMFFIFKEYIKQSKAKNKESIVSEAIGDYTAMTQRREDRKNYIQQDKPNIEEMLAHYSQLLKGLFQENDDQTYKKRVLNLECNITFDGLGELMKDEDQKYLYLYLDKIGLLSTDEQQRINTLLYTRGAIHHDRWIRVKINNGKGSWKTRMSASGDRVRATHDYYETTIYENDV